MKSFSQKLLVCALAVLPLTAHAAQVRTCTMTRSEGDSISLRTDGAWKPIRSGALPAGALTIRTGPQSRAEIICSDGVELTVGADTTVDLQKLIGRAGPSENVLIRLIRGVIGAVAPHRNWSRFDIAAPLAIASVRSTAWLVSHDPEQGSAAFVREGVVMVASLTSRQTMSLSAGEGVDFDPHGARPKRVWAARRVAAAGARLGFGWR